MRKIIFIIAMLTSFVFISCSSSDDDDSCKSCSDVAGTGVDIEVCDNGNGTATVTSSLGGTVVSTTTLTIQQGESIDTINCSDLTDVIVDTSD